jgi:DNA-binding LacI/PurR family transcriptional regulator
VQSGLCLDVTGAATANNSTIDLWPGVAARHWAEGFRPQLTAADVPTLEMGTHAVDLLLERIATPTSTPRHLLLTPPISLRDSTGPAPTR